MRFNIIVILFSMILLVANGCSFVASRVVPLNDIQSPNGNFEVGSQIFYWIDGDRNEWFSEIDDDKRELIVQVWYPATSNGKKRAKWVDHPKDRVEAIIDKYDVPKFIAKAVDRVDTDTYLDADPVEGEDFPVIIFSHGFQGFRTQNTIQIQELVSNGYIVFALDHTYDAVVTVFPDGRKIHTAEQYCYGCEADEFYDVFLPQIDTRVSDVRFVINQIEKIKSGTIQSNLSSILDIDRLGVFGHSFGGGTSLAATILDSRIKSCLSLDGWYVPVHPDIYSRGLSKPFLHLGQVEWDEKINYEIRKAIK